jgi:anti-anti-sigma regulatory factor
MTTQDTDDNNISLKGSILTYVLKGSVDADVFSRLKKVGEGALDAKLATGVLIDVSRVDRFSSVTRHDLLMFLSGWGEVKFAFLGGNNFVKKTITLMISTVDPTHVCLAQNKEDALKWMAAS